MTTVVALRRARAIPIQERRKSLHPTVIDQVLKALGSLCSLPAVAKRTGVSLSSVYRILGQYPTTPRPRQDEDGIAQGPLRRASWVAALQACRMEGMGGVAAARARAGADYAWLYRHDRAWLVSTNNAVPSFKRRNGGSGRVDWVRRDTELCQLLQQQLSQLRDEAPPQRLTKTRLLRSLGETMVRRNLGQLPQLVVLLDKEVESEQAFGMRRVDYAVALLVVERPSGKCQVVLGTSHLERRHGAEQEVDQQQMTDWVQRSLRPVEQGPKPAQRMRSGGK